ncbi:MAG TPA: ABC transporter permease [Actinomycetota bacterium]|nr:ABC transporter permease [Actinomycetota bacterium]
MADDQGERLALATTTAAAERGIGGRAGGRERGRGLALVAAVPAVLWMVAFFVVPLGVFAFYSLLTNAFYDVAFPLTTDAYVSAVTSPLNRTLAWNSASVGLTTGAITVAVGLPVAYWLRFVAGRSRVAVLFLITSSMFASYLVRIYAWRTILGSRGVVNSVLDRVGLIDEPLGFLLYSRFAVVLALVHIFLPYVVLVLYAAMAPLGRGLLEAGEDLGAGSSLLWRRVILPIMAAPAVSAFVFVFILSAADYVTPQFLGGRDGLTLGVQIQSNFITVGNWPLAAATSILMLLAFLLLFLLLNALLRFRRLHDLRIQT